MSQPSSTALAAPHSWRRALSFPGLAGACSLACTFLGLLWLTQHQRSSVVVPYRAACGLTMILLALVQARLAYATRSQVRHRQHTAPVSRRTVARAMFVGIVVAYGLAICLGPAAGGKFVLMTLIAAWGTLLMLTFSADTQTLDRWRRLAQNKTIRASAMTLYFGVLAVVSMEVVLRTLGLAMPLVREPVLSAVDQTATDEDTVEISTGNGPSPNKTAVLPVVAAAKPNRFRVAVLGDEATLAASPVRGSTPAGYLNLVKQSLPGLELQNFGSPAAWPGIYAAQVEAICKRSSPDLVLTFISVSDDITAEPATISCFDWRSLKVAQLFAGTTICPPTRKAAREEQLASDASQRFLEACGPQLVVCRTPMDERMRERWEQTFAALDSLSEACRTRQAQLALVVIPGQFQVNRLLCDTLRRRQGYEAEQLDLELPQRRLATYAADRKLPVLDLLPYLRSSEESVYLPNQLSWNQHGDTVAASAVGGWLQSRFGGALMATAQLSAD